MIAEKIKRSIENFDLDLKDKTVLTEAATGNYTITAVIAALGGAEVYAFTGDSKYGPALDAKTQTLALAVAMGVEERIKVVMSLEEVDLKSIDILTNTGFLRPITRNLVEKLSPGCVVPLMWEPWEHREDELDIKACSELGIKVYGTDEGDERVRTKEYIGLMVLSLLLENKLSPFSSNILLIGCEHFTAPVEKVLTRNGYELHTVNDYSSKINIKEFNVIVIAEHQNKLLIVGKEDAYISTGDIRDDALLVHICGNVSLQGARFRSLPESPRPFGHMSFTTDYIDDRAVIDLHTASLKVAEGMLTANGLGLKGIEYKEYMEKNYPALAFDDPKYW